MLRRYKIPCNHVPHYFKKDGPGPVMVSDTLCPAVHILGTCLFFEILKFRQGSGPKGEDVLQKREGNFRPSVGGRGSLRADGVWRGGW